MFVYHPYDVIICTLSMQTLWIVEEHKFLERKREHFLYLRKKEESSHSLIAMCRAFSLSTQLSFLCFTLHHCYTHWTYVCLKASLASIFIWLTTHYLSPSMQSRAGMMFRISSLKHIQFTFKPPYNYFILLPNSLLCMLNALSSLFTHLKILISVQFRTSTLSFV